MATLYSTLYGSFQQVGTSAGAISATTTYKYKGPTPQRKGEPCVRYCTYDLAGGTLSATNTSLVLADLVAGEKVIEVLIGSSADLDSGNDFTFNLGTTTTATAYASASTALQAATASAAAATQLDIANATVNAAAVAAAGDQLILARAAGDLNSTGTLYFKIVSTT